MDLVMSRCVDNPKTPKPLVDHIRRVLEFWGFGNLTQQEIDEFKDSIKLFQTNNEILQFSKN